MWITRVLCYFEPSSALPVFCKGAAEHCMWPNRWFARGSGARIAHKQWFWPQKATWGRRRTHEVTGDHMRTCEDIRGSGDLAIYNRLQEVTEGCVCFRTLIVKHTNSNGSNQNWAQELDEKKSAQFETSREWSWQTHCRPSGFLQSAFPAVCFGTWCLWSSLAATHNSWSEPCYVRRCAAQNLAVRRLRS